MRRFFDSSPPLLNPVDLVSAFTGRTAEELALPERVIIVFDSGDLKRVLNKKKHRLIDAWLNFRWLYRIEESNTIITRSYFGGPNIAALVEELAVFGVKEFVIWGYAGGIDNQLKIGDVIVAKGALREDGISYHYVDDEDDFVYSDWFEEWEQHTKEWGFREGIIWSCDAIYRETREKIRKYRKAGISAVEMEVASFYAVCTFKGVKGIALLIVSDLLNDEGWTGGFHTKPFREGVKKMSKFMQEMVVK
ncbi:MAG: nucleoside phosphorylase [Proteobacteria bacterium]|nr:nucleoside phosphorylase [Pseudomonadota bacterium]